MPHSDENRSDQTAVPPRTFSESQLKPVPVRLDSSKAGQDDQEDVSTKSLVRMPRYRGNQLSWIKRGRSIMERLYGSTDHGIKSFVALVSVLTVGSVVPIALVIESVNWLAQNVFFGLGVMMASLLALLGLVEGGWGPILMASETECPECQHKFMFLRKDRFLVNSVTVQGTEVTNFLINYRCGNCGYSEDQVPETEVKRIEQSI